MENQIRSLSKAIVAKSHKAKIIEWFDLHVDETGKKFGFNFDSCNLNLNNKDNEKSINDSRLIVEIDWKMSSEDFVKNLGKIFSICVNQRSLDSKTTLGQEFTPMDTVSSIFNGIVDLKNICETTNILDFACGTGNFIGWCLRYQLEAFFKDQNEKRTQNMTKNFYNRLETLSHHLIAVDIDPLSCFTTAIYTSLIILHFILRFNLTFDKKIQKMCFPVWIIHENFFDFGMKYPTISPEIILGNPPYLFSRNLPVDTLKLLKSRKFQSARGQFDLSDVFLEHSMNLLQSGGILGVIIPETITILENRQKIRKYLIKNSDVLKIQHVSGTFTNISVENILLFAQKSQKVYNEMLTISWENFQSQIIKRSDLLEKTHFPLIYSTNITKEIIAWVEKNFISIDEWNEIHPEVGIKVFRGVELSKKGEIMQCPKCDKWMPYSKKRKICSHCNSELNRNGKIKKIIKKMEKLGEAEKFRPFIPHFTSNQPCAIPSARIELGYSGIKYKKLHDFCPQRILVRQLLAKKRLCATTVNDHSLTSQSIYNIILPQPLQADIQKLRNILASDLISYYNYTTFSKGKRLFSRILLQKLKNLPWIPRNQKYSIINQLPNHFIPEITTRLGEKDTLI
ncbi:Eco57I restriction-modification methylase domain-containing protein [Candidatus Lokiarchaeum ossiferum]|uniref:Eco57I restriction-modification methylase domain-containing protein n=1 Tax=Candidatus Lokiarchaeum ossiferum TaxID=2951803 RepID=UPI00352F25DF